VDPVEIQMMKKKLMPANQQLKCKRGKNYMFDKLVV